jgi:hypothetical protein
MGGGRGIAGMRERAEALGGTLSAGPGATDANGEHGEHGDNSENGAVGGGWSVRGTFPLRLTAPGGWQWPEILDALTAAFGVTLPLAVVFTPPAMMRVTPVTVPLAVILLAAHTAPLWWRRRRPFTAMAAVMGVDLAATAGALLTSPDWLQPLALAWMVEMVAVYSVAAYDPNRLRAASGPLVAGATAGIIAAAAFVAYPEPYPPEPGAATAILVLVAIVVAFVMAAFWVWGTAVRRRRMRGLAWERDALEAIAARTWEVLRVERHRVAAGLRGAVLEHTARLVREAESALARRPTTAAAMTATPSGAPAATPGGKAPTPSGKAPAPGGKTGATPGPAGPPAASGEADAAAALAEVAGQARMALNGMRELLDMMEEKE